MRSILRPLLCPLLPFCAPFYLFAPLFTLLRPISPCTLVHPQGLGRGCPSKHETQMVFAYMQIKQELLLL